MQYPNVEARNWRLAFKTIKRIFALFLSGALHLDGKQQPKCHTITIFDQCKLLCNVIWIHPQTTARSANWRLFKQLKRFLPCFHVVIDICMKTNPTLDNWKIVAEVLSFKMVWIGAHSHPLKRPMHRRPLQHRTPNNGFAIFGGKGHVTPKITWQQNKCLLPRYLQVLFTKTLKTGIFETFLLTASFSCRPF